MRLTVRRAGLEDHLAVSHLFNEYRIFYQQASDIELATSFIRERIENNESVILIASNDDDEILGFTQLYPTFSSVSAKKSLVLNDLFVRDDARRLGVARALMIKASEYASSINAKGLALETGIDNTSAQALYESLGYEKDKSCYHYYLAL